MIVMPNLCSYKNSKIKIRKTDVGQCGWPQIEIMRYPLAIEVLDVWHYNTGSNLGQAQFHHSCFTNVMNICP